MKKLTLLLLIFLSVIASFSQNPDIKTYEFECVPLLVKKPNEKIVIRSKIPGDSEDIQNPYYKHPVWRLWFKDASPIEYNRDSTRTIFTISDDQRDNDCYMSLDYGHSDGILKPQKNYFTAPNYHHASLFAPPELLEIFGVNYTAESLTSRGRYIMDDQKNNEITERNFFFSNVVRTSAGYICYSDTFPDKVYDEYDALQGHSLQSIGHSGSMMLGIKKMIDAGEYIPKSTRELLKTNGLYAVAMMTLYKAALPYTDVKGNPVPYESELLHRPVYNMSAGRKIYADRWYKLNTPYHQFNDQLHFQKMVQMAKDMKVPPPVTIMNFTGINVTKGKDKLVSNQMEDERLKSINKTIIRIWGKEGETLDVGIDLGRSFDLTGRPLIYHVKVLYPNQKNVKIIKGKQEGIFRVIAKYDPKLPKGRIPVLFYVTNGEELPGNPVFLNFYWPEKGETQADYPHDPGSYTSVIPKGLLININKRPVIRVEAKKNLSDTISAESGSKVSFTIHSIDPEGYTTSIYRWEGEPGRFSGNKFNWQIPSDNKKAVYPLHFILSDGTGGYAGKTIWIKIE